MNITKERVKQRFDTMITETTIYSREEYQNVEMAVSSLIDATFQNLNDVEILTQQMIDEQSATHDGYLDGARVGDLVLGHDDCWVSQLTVDGWRIQSEKLVGNAFSRARDIAEYIENDLAFEMLSKFNAPRENK